jgi:hypothetical protein
MRGRASVVNGAQTVGSIISAIDGGPNGFQRARVFVKIIDLERVPPTFAAELTRAANTQNRIEKKDFAALDPEQDRLKTEFLLECEKFYAYKTGDRDPSPDEGCTLDDAAVALACAQKDVGLCVQAKREVGRLYDDIQQAPYKILFNPSLTALRMWRSVEVMRLVDDALKKQASHEGKDRLIAVHGNRFVLHLVFRSLGNYESATPEDFEEIKKRIPEVTLGALARVTAAKERQAASSYPANFFKNATKCKELEAAIA